MRPTVASSCLLYLRKNNSRKPTIQCFISLNHLNISRCFHTGTLQRASDSDQRARLSLLWAPTGGIAIPLDEDAHSKLIRAGFLRQAHSGIFHMLPLGLRVQQKLEALIDKYMLKLGASKLSLSSISSQEIWAQSGRLDKASSELFRFEDRRKVGYLLSPTHEEEITSLVAKDVKSYKELPIRLYQISRKYRDERRPRFGLLRSREFLMKDLYTFDYCPVMALATYHEVRAAYGRLFDELKIPYLVAEADSGDIGGDLSHEFHFPTSTGEDRVISCTACSYVANEELAETPISEKLMRIQHELVSDPQDVKVWRGTSKDRKTLVNVWYQFQGASHSLISTELPINIHAVKALFPELDPSVEDPAQLLGPRPGTTSVSPKGPFSPTLVLNIFDYLLPESLHHHIASGQAGLPTWTASCGSTPSNISTKNMSRHPTTGNPLNLLRIRDGDACPRCTQGTLKVQKAIELGHTFHLGTRYSDPLNAKVAVPAGLMEEKDTQAQNIKAGKLNSTREVAIQMGCHGIGVSRMIAAVADTLSDEKGLNWPRVIAPYEVVVISTKDAEEDATTVYDALCGHSSAKGARLDTVLDDRKESFAWKLRDADLVGYPVIVVIGKRWAKDKMCEVQCRRLGVKRDLRFEGLGEYVTRLLEQL